MTAKCEAQHDDWICCIFSLYLVSTRHSTDSLLMFFHSFDREHASSIPSAFALHFLAEKFIDLLCWVIIIASFAVNRINFGCVFIITVMSISLTNLHFYSCNNVAEILSLNFSNQHEPITTFEVWLYTTKISKNLSNGYVPCFCWPSQQIICSFVCPKNPSISRMKKVWNFIQYVKRQKMLIRCKQENFFFDTMINDYFWVDMNLCFLGIQHWAYSNLQFQSFWNMNRMVIKRENKKQEEINRTQLFHEFENVWTMLTITNHEWKSNHSDTSRNFNLREKWFMCARIVQ